VSERYCEIYRNTVNRADVNLECHFYGKESGEGVIDVTDNNVAETGAVQWVLGSQSNATSTNDNDDERIESIRRHQAVNVPAYTAKPIAYN